MASSGFNADRLLIPLIIAIQGFISVIVLVSNGFPKFSLKIPTICSMAYCSQMNNNEMYWIAIYVKSNFFKKCVSLASIPKGEQLSIQSHIMTSWNLYNQRFRKQHVHSKTQTSRTRFNQRFSRTKELQCHKSLRHVLLIEKNFVSFAVEKIQISRI